MQFLLDDTFKSMRIAKENDPETVEVGECPKRNELKTTKLIKTHLHDV